MTTKPDFCEGFSYTKGVVHTSVPWRMPTLDKFFAWWRSFLPSVKQTPFSVWLCGGFLEGKPDTWDVDIILTKRHALEPEDYQQLSDLMIEATQLSLNKFNILVDIQFYENFEDKDVVIDGVRSFWYSTEDYLKMGSKDSVKWVAFDSVYKNGQKLVDYRDPGSRAVEIIPHLWKVVVATPSVKYERRIREHSFIEPEPLLLHSPDEVFISNDTLEVMQSSLA